MSIAHETVHVPALTGDVLAKPSYGDAKGDGLGDAGNPAEDVPTELTDEQRATVAAYASDHPEILGYKRLLRNALEIRFTKQQADTLVRGDDDLRNAILKRHKLDEASLMTSLGAICADPNNPKQLDGLKFGIETYHRNPRLHGVVEVDVSHSGNVTVEHERRLTLDDVFSLARQLAGPGDGAVDVVPAARSLLPAPEDG